MTRFFPYAALLAVITVPLSAFAHEVYVLDPETVRRALSMTSANPFTAYADNVYHFFFWGAVSAVVLSTMLFASFFRIFERRLDPVLFYFKRFAHPLVRLTVAASVASFGMYGALFGPELPFAQLFGAYAGAMQIAFVVFGLLIALGVYTRTISALLLGLYAYACCIFGTYLLTYTDHLGAFTLLLILGSGHWSLGQRFNMARMPNGMHFFLRQFAPYAFPLMRMLFGFGIMFAAIYAKFIHSELALQVVLQYNLTHYFPFDPLFIVLGALIIEFLAGLMLFLGIEIRWTGLFLIFWLTLSLLYFQEAVWPHIVLFGLGTALFCHGYDRYSLGGWLLKRRGSEPVF